MFTTIINDCRCENSKGRQIAQVNSLLHSPVNFIGVDSGAGGSDAWADLEAAGNLIDILDLYQDTENVILVNVAPRGGRGKKWSNGTPFGYFYYKSVLVVTTVDGHVLSLIKKLQLVDDIALVDTKEATEAMHAAGFLSEELVNRIGDTQFRSLEFSPRLAAFLKQGHQVPHSTYHISEIPDAPGAIWWIDNFGNAKTTLFADDVANLPGEVVKTVLGDIPFYRRLKDVPGGETALVIGSSGFGAHRFIELVAQGASAQEKLKLALGDQIL